MLVAPETSPIENWRFSWEQIFDTGISFNILLEIFFPSIFLTASIAF